MELCKYIIANKEQELDILSKLEKEGFKWSSNARPQDLLPSKEVFSDFGFDFPYTIVAYKDKIITWSSSLEDPEGKAVFDGRKEEKMTEVKKYKVTKEFMDKLVEWRDKLILKPDLSYRSSFVSGSNISDFPYVVDDWWIEDKNPMERNNRLIAIISWLNGEDVFEVEQSNKFIVRNDTSDSDGYYYYVQVYDGITDRVFSLRNATRFDTYGEAKEWANSHQVIIEVDKNGKEV